jgi:hypothetical protein
VPEQKREKFPRRKCFYLNVYDIFFVRPSAAISSFSATTSVPFFSLQRVSFYILLVYLRALVLYLRLLFPSPAMSFSSTREDQKKYIKRVRKALTNGNNKSCMWSKTFLFFFSPLFVFVETNCPFAVQYIQNK